MMQEQKAKAYDEAIERAKECYTDGLSLHQPVKDVLEHIFPELKESEDEMIMEMVLKAFKLFAEKQAFIGHCLDDIDWDKCISWIEKQAEHAKFCDPT